MSDADRVDLGITARPTVLGTPVSDPQPPEEDDGVALRRQSRQCSARDRQQVTP
jgi:hypothetical protein